MNIFDFLERAQIRFPKKDALIFEGRKITYGEVYKQACCLSAALSKRFAVLLRRRKTRRYRGFPQRHAQAR